MNKTTNARLGTPRTRGMRGLYGWQSLVGAMIGAAIGLGGVAFTIYNQGQITQKQQSAQQANTRKALVAEINVILDQEIQDRDGIFGPQDGNFVCQNFTHSRIFNGLGEKLVILTPDEVAKIYPAYLNERMMSSLSGILCVRHI